MGMEERIADIGSAEADLDPSTDRYAARFSGPTGEWLLSVQTKAIREMIAPWKGGTVLDVGGGHGQVAGPLMADGHDVTVLASSERAYGQAARLDPAPHLVTGNLMDLPFEDRSFDVVTAVRMMAHVGDWERFLAGLCRVARHAVIVDFPVPGGANALKPLLFGLKKRLEGDTRKFATMKKAAVREVFAAEGFETTRTHGQFVLPMVVHRKLKAPGISATLETLCKKLLGDSALASPKIQIAVRST